MAVVFIFENSYQQYYSEFVASRLQLNSSSIIFVGYGINKPLFLEKSNKSKFIYIEKNILSILNMIKENRSVFFLKKEFIELKVTDVFLYKDHNYFNSRLIKVLSKINISSHLIEEGLSMYMLKNLKNIKKHGLLASIKYRFRQLLFYIGGAGLNIEEFGLNPNLKSIHAFEPHLVPKVKCEIKVYSLPNQVWDKKVEANLCSKIKVSKDTKKFGILFLSQPFVLLKRRTIENQLFIVQSIINIVNSLGYNLILKTHPKENKNMYSSLIGGFKILNHLVEPAELIIPNMNIRAMISEGSSTSINAARTFGLKSFILKTDMFDKLEITQFNKLINNYCTIINLDNDGFEILKKELTSDLKEMSLNFNVTKFKTIENLINK